MSPALAVAGKATLTETVGLPAISAALSRPSLLTSGVMVTTGAPGASSTMRAASLTGPAALPAGSEMVAVETKSVLLAVGLNCTFTLPAAMSVAVSVKV